MPRQRIHHSRVTYDFPEDFPARLERFRQESGLSWAEIARRLGNLSVHRMAVADERGVSQHPSHDGAS